MNLALAQAIVNCLRTPREAPRPALLLERFVLRDWERMFRWLDLSGLALYLWQRLKDSEATNAVPLAIRVRLERNQMENKARVADAAKEFATLNKLWEESGVRFAALKGFAMIPDYCQDAALRTQYDHDYLLDAESLPAAEAALHSAGYVRKNPHEEHPLAFFRPHHAAPMPAGPVNFYSPRLPRPVELHTRLWEANDERIEIAPSEGALGRARLRNWNGACFAALDDADALVFQVLHAFRHVLRNWCRLSIFLEIARFLERRSSDTEFWEQFRDRIENRGWLPEAAGGVFSLASNLFAVPVPNLAGPFTVDAMTPAMILWIGEYGKSSALRNFQGNKHSLFLHREFVDDLSAWREVRRRRLFPFVQIPRALKLRAPGRVFPLKATWMQGIHLVRRTKFHITAALSYALAYPVWRRRLRSPGETTSARKRVEKDFVGPAKAVRLPEE